MRIGIISDIHANLIALERILQAIGPVDCLWCLGDVVGYGPNPNETIECLLAQPNLEICLTGNHDWAALGKIDVEDFNPDARQAALWTRAQLSEQSRKFLQERPAKVVPNAEFTLVHASPREPIMEYIMNTAIARVNFPYFQTPICLVGHTHRPAGYILDDEGIVHDYLPIGGEQVNLRNGLRFILNPGSIGQPRDGDPRASFALWDSEQGTFEFQRVEYDVASVQHRILEAGLPSSLATRLSFGV